MKKFFLCILTVILMLLCLTACDTFGSIFGGKSGVSKKYYENCAVFTFNDFESRTCITLDRTGLGEGAIYYQVNLEEGALSVKYSDVGLIHQNQPLFEFSADDEMPINGSGGYIEGDKIAITFEAFGSVKGEIIIAFTEDALKAVHKELQLHDHSFTYTSLGKVGHYATATCGCPSEEGTTPHYDGNTDYFCDDCKCDMTEFADEWLYDETHHWYVSDDEAVYCYGEHESLDADMFCDICAYQIDFVENLTDVAQILLEYEQSEREKLENLRKENPEYFYYFHPVTKVHCTLILSGEASADAIVAKYDMNNLLIGAEVSALNAIKMVSILFDRNEFTEEMHNTLKQISSEEAIVENLFIDMTTGYDRSYMPKIEYYVDDAKTIKYTVTGDIVTVFDGKDHIFKTKDEYEAYLDALLETAQTDYQRERITAARNLYDEAFFKEKSLIITRMITRGSCSIALTVNNLYVSGNKVYVVIRTDEPEAGDAAMQYAFFGIIVDKDDVAEVNEIVTLE